MYHQALLLALAAPELIEALPILGPRCLSGSFLKALASPCQLIKPFFTSTLPRLRPTGGLVSTRSV